MSVPQDHLTYLFSLQRFGWKMDLERITVLLQRRGNPQRRFASVHIAGTNGKGSTAALIASILVESGVHTGLFTSPHLCVPEERIVVNGTKIAREDFLSLIADFKKDIDDCGATFFEAITAMAYSYFAEKSVETAVIETGLGGRFDATNTIVPLLTIITDLAIDHIDHLGNSIERIAFEKAGILKSHVPCVTAVNDEDALKVMRGEAAKKSVPMELIQDSAKVGNVSFQESHTQFEVVTAGRHYSKLNLPLRGAYQVRNAVLAIRGAELLTGTFKGITASAIRTGLEKVSWPGRLQTIGTTPLVIVDVAHNPSAVRYSFMAIRQLFKYQNLIVVLGILRDKDYRAMVKIVAEFADVVIAVTPHSERALQAEELMDVLKKKGVPCENGVTPLRGFSCAGEIAGRGDLILVTGSHFTVGEVLKGGQ